MHTTTTLTANAAVALMLDHSENALQDGITRCGQILESGLTVKALEAEAKALGEPQSSCRGWLILGEIAHLPAVKGETVGISWDKAMSAAKRVYNSAATRQAWADAVEDAEDRADALTDLLEIAKADKAAAREQAKATKATKAEEPETAPEAPEIVPAAPARRSANTLLTDALGLLERVKAAVAEGEAVDPMAVDLLLDLALEVQAGADPAEAAA